MLKHILPRTPQAAHFTSHITRRMTSNSSAFLDAVNTPFRIASTPVPKPGSHEIVIRNRAIALNPLDFMQYSKGVMIKSFPAVLGSDVAGEVLEVGSSVTRFKKGDRAMGHAWGFKTGEAADGAFTLFSKVPAGNAAVVPDGITYQEAAVLPMAVDTATSVMFAAEGLGLEAPSESAGSTGKTVIVYGASSSVGSMAVQLAVAAGCRVVGIAGKRNFDLVKEAGAEQVFDYSDADVVEKVLGSVDEGGIVGVFDAIGNAVSHGILVPILEKLGGTGRYVTTKATPENLPQGVQVKRAFGIGEFSFPLWEKFVTKGLESGKLKCLPRPEIIGNGLEALQSGVEMIGKGVSGKKLVVEL